MSERTYLHVRDLEPQDAAGRATWDIYQLHVKHSKDPLRDAGRRHRLEIRERLLAYFCEETDERLTGSNLDSDHVVAVCNTLSISQNAVGHARGMLDTVGAPATLTRRLLSLQEQLEAVRGDVAAWASKQDGRKGKR